MRPPVPQIFQSNAVDGHRMVGIDDGQQRAPEPTGVSLLEIPERFGDSAGYWRQYEVEARSYDKEMLKGVNANLDNSLVAAGLFAGVNATFLSQTLQALSTTPADTTNRLLASLVTHFDNTTLLPRIVEQTPFKAPSRAIRYNCFLGISLAFSILAAFGAVLGKEWLTHYENSTKPKTPVNPNRPQFWGRRRQRKLAGVRRFRVHFILQAVLPILLQTSLFFFSAGLIDYLFSLSNGVAIPVASFAVLGFLAYCSTVILALRDPSCPFQTGLSIKVIPWTTVLLYAGFSSVLNLFRPFCGRHQDNNPLEVGRSGSDKSRFICQVHSNPVVTRRNGDEMETPPSYEPEGPTGQSETVPGPDGHSRSIRRLFRNWQQRVFQRTDPCGQGVDENEVDAASVKWVLEECSKEDTLLAAAQNVPRLPNGRLLSPQALGRLSHLFRRSLTRLFSGGPAARSALIVDPNLAVVVYGRALFHVFITLPKEKWPSWERVWGKVNPVVEATTSSPAWDEVKIQYFITNYLQLDFGRSNTTPVHSWQRRIERDVHHIKDLIIPHHLHPTVIPLYLAGWVKMILRLHDSVFHHDQPFSSSDRPPTLEAVIGYETMKPLFLACGRAMSATPTEAAVNLVAWILGHFTPQAFKETTCATEKPECSLRQTTICASYAWCQRDELTENISRALESYPRHDQYALDGTYSALLHAAIPMIVDDSNPPNERLVMALANVVTPLGKTSLAGWDPTALEDLLHSTFRALELIGTGTGKIRLRLELWQSISRLLDDSKIDPEVLQVILKLLDSDYELIVDRDRTVNGDDAGSHQPACLVSSSDDSQSAGKHSHETLFTEYPEVTSAIITALTHQSSEQLRSQARRLLLGNSHRWFKDRNMQTHQLFYNAHLGQALSYHFLLSYTLDPESINGCLVLIEMLLNSNFPGWLDSLSSSFHAVILASSKLRDPVTLYRCVTGGLTIWSHPKYSRSQESGSTGHHARPDWLSDGVVRAVIKVVEFVLGREDLRKFQIRRALKIYGDKLKLSPRPNNELKESFDKVYTRGVELGVFRRLSPPTIHIQDDSEGTLYAEESSPVTLWTPLTANNTDT
ncbi:hypothetical protein FRB99_003143 [Tulasnella sp. 403]|nr:hypothetical protein FRB99_003143 [Tulasnella sp. 403]